MEIVDTLLGPILGTSDRIVVECDRFVESAMGQTNRQSTKDVHPGIDLHAMNLAVPGNLAKNWALATYCPS